MHEARRIARSGRRICVLAAALLAVCACSALFAGTATAGTYSVYSCVGPSGESLPNYAWSERRSTPAHIAVFSLDSTCPSLSVTAIGTVLSPGENAGFAFDAPAGTTISGYLVRRSVSITYLSVGTKPALSAGLRRTVGGSDSYWGECEAVVASCVIASSGTQSAGLSASGLQLGVQCAQSSSCSSLGVSLAQSTMTSARVDLTDNVAPQLSLTGGSLPGAVGTAGTRDLEVAISDVGGGVKSYWLTVDGVKGAVTNLGGSCAGVYTQRVPCPQSQQASFTVNLGSYGAGPHNAVVTAVDAAGNVASLSPVTFNYSGPTFTSNGTPAVSTAVVTTRARTIEGRGGKAVSVRGAVKTSSGSPVAGALLDVSATNIGGAVSGTSSLGTTKTSSKGEFAFRIKPKGARRITFAFRPASTSEATASASVLVRQKLSLSAKRSRARLTRGQQLTLSGKLSGTAGAAAGAPVEIYVRNGRKWQKVAVVTASKSGRYAWKHRFTRVTRPTLFTFRTVVRASSSWPWKTRTSRGVKVLVLG